MRAKTGPVDFDEQKIDSIFAELNQCHLPGAVVGIGIGGRPVYRKGFGLARMELPVVLSPSMRMRIGSTTKHFTAFTYMLLCEEGRAGIDDPVGQYLPELHPVTRNITMRQLMANTNGLRDAYDVCLQFSGLGPSLTSAEILSLYRDIDDVNAAPGATWIYNNGGWLLLSAVIERITGQSLEEVLRERIFKPTGMYDTLLRRWDSDFVPNSSTPHMMNAAGHYEKWNWMDWSGAGAMVSTVDDMLRWLAHMGAPLVGSAATWAAMQAPQILVNDVSVDYGFGLITGSYRGVRTLYNPGGWLGGSCQMLKVPAVGLDVVVIANRFDANVMLLANTILDACLPGLHPAEQIPNGPVVTGTFRSPTSRRVIRLCDYQGQQMVSVGGSGQLFARLQTENVLSLIGGFEFSKATLTLAGNPLAPDSIQLTEFGNVDEFFAVRPVEKPTAHAIVGCYRSESTGTEARIFATDAGPRLSTAGRFGSMSYALECLGDGVWQASSHRAVIPPAGVLSFEPDGKEFHYSTSQTWALPFRRCN
jgi:CubicO group peptidase (beta-lactamase class C family)